MAGSFKRRRQECLLGEKRNKSEQKNKETATVSVDLKVVGWADSFIKDGLCYVTAFCPFVADGQGCDDMA